MAEYTRREWLGTAAVGLPALLGGGDAGSPRPSEPASWRKGPVVLGRPGAPEGRWIQNFTCTAEPREAGRWRIWYSLSGPKQPFNLAVAEGVPGEPLERHEAVLTVGEPADAPLAVGNLPAGWRPVQGVHLDLPDGRHRLYFWAHGPGIARYLAAESDDGRRYRVLDPERPCLYHPSDRAVDAATAVSLGLKRLARKASARPDGEPPAPAGLVSNDATNVYRLPSGGYEMFSVGLVEVREGDPRYIAHDNAAGWTRVIDRYVSEDGLRWGGRQRVLVPDDRDPVDQQFYYLAVTHTDRGRVGMLGHYRAQAQTMDLEWCFSRDGLTWDRPLRRPWLARGRPGEPDSFGIYAGHALVAHEGGWWLFHTGVNSAHNGGDSHGVPGSVVAVARCETIWADP